MKHSSHFHRTETGSAVKDHPGGDEENTFLQYQVCTSSVAHLGSALVSSYKMNPGQVLEEKLTEPHLNC